MPKVLPKISPEKLKILTRRRKTLKKYLEERGLKKSWLAAKCGRSNSWLTFVLAGEDYCFLDGDNLRLVETSLGVKLDSLYKPKKTKTHNPAASK